MKTTNWFYKLLPSALNVLLTFGLSLPFLFMFGRGLAWKISWIVIFFLYNCIFEFFYEKRDPGMILFNTYYERKRSLPQELLYVLLYTLSFSTLLFYIWIPGDLLIINLFLVQLPFVLIAKNTLHGFLSGNIKTTRGYKIYR